MVWRPKKWSKCQFSKPKQICNFQPDSTGGSRGPTAATRQPTGRRSGPPWRTCSWDRSHRDAVKGDPEVFRPDQSRWPQAQWGQLLCGPWTRMMMGVEFWRSPSPPLRSIRCWPPPFHPVLPWRPFKHIQRLKTIMPETRTERVTRDENFCEILMNSVVDDDYS